MPGRNTRAMFKTAAGALNMALMSFYKSRIYNSAVRQALCGGYLPVLHIEDFAEIRASLADVQLAVPT